MLADGCFLPLGALLSSVASSVSAIPFKEAVSCTQNRNYRSDYTKPSLKKANEIFAIKLRSRHISNAVE